MDEYRVQLWTSSTITRAMAVEALTGRPDGEFLIRTSSSEPGSYVISLAVAGTVEHHQCQHTGDPPPPPRAHTRCVRGMGAAG